ncbi:MAG: division plane positioning ATPase MipZ [Candidatus Devosia phytovorans]|uniref:Division plane positioning ATPase MipZ n=1 Tax=Candidatus Devosia phytovorans TaxID=3121372 RepID=A0AAJ5VUI7_9HYPH|nr:division plane positioning ATPase MipZ [Devosia sp.]WEK05113.1 MAG: division plane positioning ATPase MipZ [Devosia sp.]
MAQNGAHIIAVGNEKGGSGKSTTALHLAVYLLHQGHRVATMDVDSRQQTLTRYVRNRRTTVEATGRDVPMPKHVHLPTAWGDSIRENQKIELDLFTRAMDGLRGEVDFIVIDTPGFDGNLQRLAHGFADTLVTPINDSMIDLDVLAKIDPATGEPIETSPYTRNVQKARAERLAQTGKGVDWVLMRNRISNLGSRNASQVQETIEKLAQRIGCRVADGIAERVIFRSLFPIGMTVFDPLEADVLGSAPSMSHVNARAEYRGLVAALNLPLPGEPMKLSA